ncbi:Flavin reductase like domain protein [Tsuneonella dongtanensis]|uniref:Flavin reductase like domain protein n=1 Tax=Tsuneonella dongtanensis TaxID=692370 RepID=A0A1B2ABQ4_9SPHN|nr:flavin reductase family protein [Tsuneonella dongtanensis]ANY19590.1 Flavin reductase like domain protein [Tsuneonella dongtanensis]
MFYKPRNGHGLPHNPLQACIVPRPIGWISTLSTDGVANLAPFSHFNIVGMLPPMVAFCNNGPHAEGSVKDSARNAIATGEFVHSVATFELREQVVQSSAHVSRDCDEFDFAGLTKAPSRMVAPPRVGESPISLECRVVKHVELPTTLANSSNVMVIGEVVGVHIAESVMTDGLVDVGKLRPLARMGYLDYASVAEVFSIARPDDLLVKY